jgi:transcriptional regulator with XRE-family HTH domain
MAVNKRLKAARAAKGITQLQLAQLLGVKEIDISRYETGRSVPESQMKSRIAEVLGRMTFELFDS